MFRKSFTLASDKASSSRTKKHQTYISRNISSNLLIVLKIDSKEPQIEASALSISNIISPNKLKSFIVFTPVPKINENMQYVAEPAIPIATVQARSQTLNPPIYYSSLFFIATVVMIYAIINTII